MCCDFCYEQNDHKCKNYDHKKVRGSDWIKNYHDKFRLCAILHLSFCCHTTYLFHKILDITLQDSLFKTCDRRLYDWIEFENSDYFRNRLDIFSSSEGFEIRKYNGNKFTVINHNDPENYVKDDTIIKFCKWRKLDEFGRCIDLENDDDLIKAFSNILPCEYELKSFRSLSYNPKIRYPGYPKMDRDDYYFIKKREFSNTKPAIK
jgi:hypothetical protein